jgi:hypothetical protein
LLFCYFFFQIFQSVTGSSRPLEQPAARALCLWLVYTLSVYEREEQERESKSGERDHSTFQLAVWRLPSNRCGSFSLPEFFFCFFSFSLLLFAFEISIDTWERFIPWQIQMNFIESK